MSAIDWVLLAIVAVSALFGLMRGLIGVLASLAAWLLAGWAAFQFGAQVALMLASDSEPGAGQLFGGYALAFIVVLMVVGLVGWIVRKLAHSVGLSGLDRMFGLLLGTARGAFIACALLLLLGLTELPREASWQASRVVPLFVPGAQWMTIWLPDWVARRVDLHGEAEGAALLSPASLPMLPGSTLPASDLPAPELPTPAIPPTPGD
jgi:membrane protein required for colicin V production